MSTRPLRHSQFRHSDWYPEPPVHLPTPSGLRAARAAAKTSLGSVLDSDLNGSHKIPHAQQMQARALAAQAAHQMRVGNHIVAPSNPSTSPDHPFRTGDEAANQKDDMDFPTFPTLNKPLDDLIDEIQVDLSLSLIEEDFLPFTSPNTTVDISAWLPAPGPPVLIASEANIAASAVPLTDWAAEFCWHLGGRSLTPRLNYAEVLHHPPVRSHLLALDSAFSSFQSDVKQALSATLTSPQGLFLGLYYVSRMPIGQLVHRNISSSMPAPSSLNAEELSFRHILYEDATKSSLPTDSIARCIFALALILSNKWLEDNTFTIKTWHDVTGIPGSRLKQLEVAALRILKFSLSVSPFEWHHWLELLRRHTASMVAREPIGDRWSINAVALSKLDSVIQQSPLSDAAVPLDQSNMIEPREKSSDHPRDLIFGVHQSWTPSMQPPNLPTPSKWGDMQFDTPIIVRPSNTRYEAVQPSNEFHGFGEFDIYSDLAVQAAYRYDNHLYPIRPGGCLDIPCSQLKSRRDLSCVQPLFDYHFHSLPPMSHNHFTTFPGNTEPDLRLWPHPGHLLLPSYT